MDIKTDRRAFGHRGFTHSLLAVFALLAPFTLRFRKAGSFRLMRYKECAGLFEPHTCRYADTRRCSPLWPCRWRFRLPILVPQKGNHWNVLSAWHYLSGRYGCPIHSREQRCSLVIANDQYLADPVHRLIKHQVEY